MAAFGVGRKGSSLDRGGGADGVPAAARRRELYGPLRSRLGLCGHGPGVFLPLRPVSYRLQRWRWGPPACRWCCCLVPAPLLHRADHASRCRGETALNASCPGWRRVRVCLAASFGVPEVEVGIGRNLCWPGRHRRGGACGCRQTFLEGVGATLPLPSPYRGKPLAAASSSSRSFLEVLIGTGASEARSLVGDLRWVQRPRGFFVSLSIRRCRRLFLLYFLFLFFWA